MRSLILTLIALIMVAGLSAQQVLSVYDIQSSVDAAGNSTYDGQTVTVRAIVTHVIPNSAFYIGDASGGPWSGVYVYHRNTSNAVSVGDDVQLTCVVDEYYNLTELTNVSSFEIFSSGNPLPPAWPISTADMAFNSPDSEQWEGVLVRFNNVQIKSTVDNYGQFKFADDSNVQAMADNGLFAFNNSDINVGDWWYMIQGIVDYHSSAGYKVNPRNQSDMIKTDALVNASITIESKEAELNKLVDVAMLTSHVNLNWYVSSYTASFKIDPTKVLFQGIKFEDTLSRLWDDDDSLTVSPDGDLITIYYNSMEPLFTEEDDAVLIILQFEPVSYGESVIDLQEFCYVSPPNSAQLNNLNDGILRVPIKEKVLWLNILNATTGSTKNIFNPELNEKIMLEYGTQATTMINRYKAIIRIYDIQGRLVATPVNKNIGNLIGINRELWDGRDYNRKLCPIGVYYCHYELIERSTGKKETTIQPIVIKSILD